MTEPNSREGGEVVFLISASSTPCGIEMFARELCRTLAASGVRARAVVAAGRFGEVVSLWRALRGAKALVVNLPVVAWKKALLLPLAALGLARLRGAETVVVVHEWADLHPLRRAFVGLYLTLAQVALFASPSVRDEFLRGPLARRSLRIGVIAIPPNIAPPATRLRSPGVRGIEEERGKGRLILGCFGSIYPKKRSLFTLDVASALRRQGHDVYVVFIGDFIRGTEDIEAQFRARLAQLDLTDCARVTGYVESEAEIFAYFDAVDVFVYAFKEGLSSRRGSVLTCLESGRPVLVNAPRDAREFDHHCVYRDLIGAGALEFVPCDASAEDYARALAARDWVPRAPGADIFVRAWTAASEALCAALKRT